MELTRDFSAFPRPRPIKLTEEKVAEPAPQPVDRSHAKNPLRPERFDEVIGQAHIVGLLKRVIESSQRRAQPLDHMLLVGASGTGKSTMAIVVANELDVDVYQVEAPVSHEMLLALRTQMLNGDVLFIDELHQQAILERRGRSAGTQPEVLFSVMEDRTLTSGMGVLPFPQITVIGATTDEGMLPDAFINRFPLRPVLAAYTPQELAVIAEHNAVALGRRITEGAAGMIAAASRGVPRQVNNYVRNAAMLTDGVIAGVDAEEAIVGLNRTTLDGLTLDMQRMLTFLLERGRRVNAKRRVSYQASVNTIATALGKSRDSKAIALRVEPYLIERGYIQVGHGGRFLTPEGVKRARELLEGHA